MPAARQRVIDRATAGRLNCRVLAEAANGPTTPEADLVLAERASEITVLPDILITALAEGNDVIVAGVSQTIDLPEAVARRVEWLGDVPQTGSFAAVLIEPREGGILDLLSHLGTMPGAIPLVQMGSAEGCYRADWLWWCSRAEFHHGQWRDLKRGVAAGALVAVAVDKAA